MANSNGTERPPTLDDVARRASVSRQTISRVVNQKGEVSEATRQRVLSAIAELGYQPNVLARALATSRSDAIGLVVPNITQPFYPEIARGVEDAAQAAGYSVFLCHTDGDPERELHALARLRGHRVAGVIVCNSRLDDAALARAVGGFSPVVLVGREVEAVRGTVIWPGYDRSGELATAHLIGLGRRRIAYLGVAYSNNVDQAKFRGYLTALERAGVPFDADLVVRTASTFQGGYDGMAALRARGLAVDGVFAFNDLMAIGAMRWAARHGVRVPERLAVVGFGGTDVAGMVTPGLSTIAVPLHSMGTTATQELLALIGGAGAERRHVHAQPELVVRGSTVAGADEPALATAD